MKRVGVLVAAVCSSVAAHAGTSTRLYLRAQILDEKGRAHVLELWRDGDRLRRDSDGRLSLFVTHGPEDRFHVVDRARGLAYQIEPPRDLPLIDVDRDAA